MRGNGLRDTPAAWRIESGPRERYIFSSRRLLLATRRARRAEEEIWWHLWGYKVYVLTYSRPYYNLLDARYTKALDNIKTLRKDRVADLKAEKERLSSLSLEKSHADKLKGRMSDISSDIAAKEIERNELNERYNTVVAANAKFLETATKFREIFVKVEALGEKKKRYQEELDSARENLQEIQGII